MPTLENFKIWVSEIAFPSSNIGTVRALFLLWRVVVGGGASSLA